MSGPDSSVGRLMTKSELGRLKARLGLPDHVIEFLRQQPRLSRKAYVAGFVAFLVLASILIFPPFMMYSAAFARLLVDSDVLPRNAILVDLDFATPVFALIAAIFLAVFLLHQAARIDESYYWKSISFNLYQVVDPKQRNRTIVTWIINRVLKNVDRSLGARAYLAAFERRSAAIMGYSALGMYLIASAFFTLDLKSISYVTPDGVTLSPYFSRRVLEYEWSEIVRIRTGCATTSGRSKAHILQYWLTFADGRTTNLGAYKATGMSRLKALETVDRKLAARHVPKRPGEMDDRCLKAKRRSYGREDYERLERILQPGAA